MTFGARPFPSLEKRLMRENAKLKREIEKLKRAVIKTTTKLVKAKQPGVIDLKKRAWAWFSRWVRITEKGVCFTCGKGYEWKDMDAGHYFTRGSGGALLHMFPRNVHSQCTRCNRWLHGNMAKYRERMVEVYGQSKVDHLDLIRTKTVGIFKPTRQYYLSLAAKYKVLVENLGG